MGKHEKDFGNNDLTRNLTSGGVRYELSHILESKEIISVLSALRKCTLREVKSVIGELLAPFDEKELYAIACEISTNYKPHIVAFNFKYFKQTDINKKLQIIDFIIAKDPIPFILNFKNFELNDEELIFECINKLLNKTYKDYASIDSDLPIEMIKALFYNYIEVFCEKFAIFGITNPDYLKIIGEKVRINDVTLFERFKDKFE